MKNLPIALSLAAVIAFVLVPTPAMAGSLCFALSLAIIFTADYVREIKPLSPRAAVLAFPAQGRTTQVCEQAA